MFLVVSSGIWSMCVCCWCRLWIVYAPCQPTTFDDLLVTKKKIVLRKNSVEKRHTQLTKPNKPETNVEMLIYWSMIKYMYEAWRMTCVSLCACAAVLQLHRYVNPFKNTASLLKIIHNNWTVRHSGSLRIDSLMHASCSFALTLPVSTARRGCRKQKTRN